VEVTFSTADGVPVLMHDATPPHRRPPGEVAALTWKELAQVGSPAGVSAKWRRRRCRACHSSSSCSNGIAPIEIKRAALARFGVEAVVSRVLRALEPVQQRTIVISFSADAVRLARARGAGRIGWVLERYDDGAQSEARRLAPEFLFCNYTKFPPAPERPWVGPWDWVSYEVTDAAMALDLAARGVRYMETMAVAELMTALGAQRR
jgi:glycerophosphoryl diester phosphodiesterase